MTALLVVLADAQGSPQLLGFLNLGLGKLMDLVALQALCIGSDVLLSGLLGL